MVHTLQLLLSRFQANLKSREFIEKFWNENLTFEFYIYKHYIRKHIYIWLILYITLRFLPMFVERESNPASLTSTIVVSTHLKKWFSTNQVNSKTLNIVNNGRDYWNMFNISRFAYQEENDIPKQAPTAKKWANVLQKTKP